MLIKQMLINKVKTISNSYSYIHLKNYTKDYKNKHPIITMKKIVFISILFLFQLTFFGKEEWDQLKNDASIEQTFVNKRMFQMMSNVKNQQSDAENLAYQNLLKKLDDLMVFSSKNKNSSNKIISETQQYIQSKKLQLLNTYNESGEKVSFYVNNGATQNQINELIMLVEGINTPETVAFILKGDFSLKEISTLALKMKIPGKQVFDRL